MSNKLRNSHANLSFPQVSGVSRNFDKIKKLTLF